jgi:hypothetical protein
MKAQAKRRDELPSAYLDQTSSHSANGEELLKEVCIQSCRHDDDPESSWMSDTAGHGVDVVHVFGQE